MLIMLKVKKWVGYQNEGNFLKLLGIGSSEQKQLRKKISWSTPKTYCFGWINGGWEN